MITPNQAAARVAELEAMCRGRTISCVCGGEAERALVRVGVLEAALREITEIDYNMCAYDAYHIANHALAGSEHPPGLGHLEAIGAAADALPSDPGADDRIARRLKAYYAGMASEPILPLPKPLDDDDLGVPAQDIPDAFRIMGATRHWSQKD